MVGGMQARHQAAKASLNDIMFMMLAGRIHQAGSFESVDVPPLRAANLPEASVARKEQNASLAAVPAGCAC